MDITITVTITDTEKQILENDLLDVQQWLQDGITGKIGSCKIRMAEAEKQLLLQEGASSMPTSVDLLCQNYMARPTYKNRAQRDAEAGLGA